MDCLKWTDSSTVALTNDRC
ncbi:putative Pre-mRNA splicing factor SF3B subunit, partial [Danaus plexippus plexippus]